MHMANVDVSVIIPCKNSRSKTAGIIKKFSQENDGLTLEFIIIDMNSNDGTVLESLSLIKELGLLGYVIQSGSGTVPAALNTGIFRSSGNIPQGFIRIICSPILPKRKNARRTLSLQRRNPTRRRRISYLSE